MTHEIIELLPTSSLQIPSLIAWQLMGLERQTGRRATLMQQAPPVQACSREEVEKSNQPNLLKIPAEYLMKNLAQNCCE